MIRQGPVGTEYVPGLAAPGPAAQDRQPCLDEWGAGALEPWQ